MKVSIIMACYNSKNSISQAIESILNQTYSDIELLICDDASIDNTYDKISEYASEYSQIKVFRNNENIGLTRSLNLLINEASGVYIARQDADDVSMNHRLETQLAKLNELDLDFITSRAQIIGSEKLIPGFTFNFPTSFVMNFKNPFIHGTLLIKKSVLNELNNYDEKFYYAQDYKLFSDLILKGYKFTTLKEPLYKLNIKDNISSKFIKEQDYYARCVRNNKIPNK